MGREKCLVGGEDYLPLQCLFCGGRVVLRGR